MSTQKEEVQKHYIVVEDFGLHGRAYVETDVKATSRAEIVDAIREGQYERAIRVVAFDPAACDVSSDIAHELIKAWENGIPVADAARKFAARHDITVPATD